LIVPFFCYCYWQTRNWS